MSINKLSEKRESMHIVVDNYNASGQTRRAFCDANKLSVTTLEYWIYRFKKQTSAPTACFVKIAPVAASDLIIEIHYPNGVFIKTTSSMDVVPQLIHQY